MFVKIVLVLCVGSVGFSAPASLLSGIASSASDLFSNVSSVADSVKGNISNVQDTIGDLVTEIIPSCIFGVKTVTFDLFSRDYPNGIIIQLNDSNIPIRHVNKVAFLIHGFTSDANTTNYFSLITKWLEVDDVTIFSLDWSQGACSEGITITQLLAYPNAMQNTVEVGQYVANFTIKLITEYGVILEDTIVVGHSLGAHVSGFAGKYIQEQGFGKYGQIQGLDPAGPGFEHSNCNESLCKSDAIFVEAIHTSFILGKHRPVGHVDFYMNGGNTQPRCFTPSCSHSRSIIYFSESLDPRCTFLGTQWDLESSQSVDVLSCTPKTCSVVGLDAVNYPARGTFLSETNEREPYCNFR